MSHHEEELSRITELESHLKSKVTTINQMQHQLELQKFGICKFSNGPDMICFYTGFGTYAECIAFLNCI
jgi:hypothetical protein